MGKNFKMQKKKKKLKRVHSKLDQKVFAVKEININVLEV